MSSVHKLEAAIIQLTPQQLTGLLAWLEDYYAEWNQPAENDTEPERPNQAPTEVEETNEIV